MTVNVDPASLESRRFARRVCRFNFDRLDGAALQAIEQAEPDLAIIRIDSTMIDDVHLLSELGCTPIVADTLVAYDAALAEVVGPPRNAGRVVRPVAAPERDLLEQMSVSIFAGYKSHYSANPLIDRSDILDGYTEWAMSFLDDGAAEVWFVEEAGEVAGFAACRAGSDTYQIVLGGVLPQFAGCGAYGDLVDHLIAHARASGYARVASSTQIVNLAVQRTWARRGLRLRSSQNTIHLNLMRSTEYHMGDVVIGVPANVPASSSGVSSELVRQLVEATLERLPSPFSGLVRHSQELFSGSPAAGDVLEARLYVKHHDPVGGRTTVAALVCNQTDDVVYRSQLVLGAGSFRGPS